MTNRNQSSYMGEWLSEVVVELKKARRERVALERRCRDGR